MTTHSYKENEELRKEAIHHVKKMMRSSRMISPRAGFTTRWVKRYRRENIKPNNLLLAPSRKTGDEYFYSCALFYAFGFLCGLCASAREIMVFMDGQCSVII